jgi:membrane associated rhomboid family serine protease
MFGPSDGLVCPTCADSVRQRYRRRPVARTRVQAVTAALVAVAATLFVAAHVIRAPWIGLLLVGPDVWAGEAWRFVTSAFLHTGPLFGATWVVGLMHVVFNAWWIWVLGGAIESAWSPWHLVALVVGSATAASAAEWLAGASGVGLSGVVYGLAAFLFVHQRINPTAAAVMHPGNVRMLVVWFFLCIAFTSSGFLAVANWAHGVGALWGLAAGAALRSRRRVVAGVVLAAATVALTVAAMNPRFHRYAREIPRFEESRAPDAFRDAGPVLEPSCVLACARLDDLTRRP